MSTPSSPPPAPDPAHIWGAIADCFTTHLAAVDESSWSAPTPCEEWTVRDLVDHTVGAQSALVGVVGAEIDDPTDWDQIRPALATALADPASLAGPNETTMFGEMPKQQIFGLMATDLLLHTWDLARALGRDTTLPSEAVETVQFGLQRMPDEMLRRPGGFGPAVEVGAEASAQDRLVAFSGRQP